MELVEKPKSSSSKRKTEWTPDHETILVEWADKAMCYRWLHTRANAMYNTLNAFYTVPVIIISTLTGTANFAQDRVPSNYQGLFVMIVGGFNILAGIISTIQQFLKITQLNESHRVSSIAWDKFYRNIKIELAKHPNERMTATQMIKMSKEEYDRLMETSPNIPAEIVAMFKTSFQNSENYKDIIKPEICDVLVSTEKTKNTWHTPENMSLHIKEEIEEIEELVNKEKLIKETNLKIVKEFKTLFYRFNNREATDSEIIDNLQEKMTQSQLKTCIEQMRQYTGMADDAV
jgi:hypothetical protein